MRALIFKAANIIKNAISIIKRDTDGFFRFGANNKLPNEIINGVNASGTARSCVDKLKKFVFADGLVDKTIAGSPANASQTFDDFVSDLAMNIPYFEAIAFRVVYDNTGRPSKVFSVPINYLRRKNDQFIYNPLWGEPDYKKNQDVLLQEFDPKETPQSRLLRISEQIKKHKGVQHGDILYIFNKGVGRYADTYPIPNFYSGFEDIESDSALQKLEKRNITRGFRTPIIVSTGPIDNINPDENGKTDKDKFDETIQSFVGDDAATVLHLEGATPETKPVVTTINIAEILDQTEKSRDRVGRAVCRHFNVSPVLVGFANQGQLGQNQELVNSLELMKLTVISYQSMISSALKKVFPEKDWTLTSLSLFKYIPESIVSQLTKEEVKRLFEVDVKDEAAQPSLAVKLMKEV